MPKGKKKGKLDNKKHEVAYESDTDSLLDNGSEISSQTDLRSVQDEVVDSEETDKFEEKLLAAIDALNDKSAVIRTNALKSLRTATERRWCSAWLNNHWSGVCDSLTKCMRKGRPGERSAAAALTPLLAAATPDRETADLLLTSLRPALIFLATETSADLDSRIEACNALSVLSLLLEEDVYEALNIMDSFEKIFSGSYLKGDGTVKVTGVAVEHAALHSAALDAWSVVLATLPEGISPPSPDLPRLLSLLDVASVDVRVAAAGAVAVMLTLADDDAHEQFAPLALERLRALAADSHKYVARNKRKLQRTTFREVADELEEGCCSVQKVRVGGETLQLDERSLRLHYTALAAALGPGLASALPRSPSLRAALQLEDAPPEPLNVAARHKDKLQRQLQNAAAFKARTISRAKNRDKRSAALAC